MIWRSRVSSFSLEAMMRLSVLILVLIFCASPVGAQEHDLDRLINSPRHHEWVEIPSNGRSLYSFVAYPEKARNALAVIVIHENRGLTDWVRSFADRLAGAGYIAIAPDLLSGFDPKHSRTGDFKSADDATKAIYHLDPDRITKDLLAVQKYISRVPSSNGKTAVIGFCWGGSESFRFATHSSGISAALVFYGSAPEDKEQIRRISAPVYGFYGGNDQRITAAVPETRERMKKYGKAYEDKIYEGAGHAFMRLGEDPKGSPANRKAQDDSWVRIKQILSRFR
jgi:carboxymethylenebutenolidase